MKAGKRGEMNRCNYIGQMGESIAKIIFPCLEVTQRFEDKNGLDGRIEGKTIQVKADQRIEESGHIYHEYWEKSIGHPEQPWRRSPSPVDLYLFVTAGLYVYISANALAKREVGRQLKKFSQHLWGFCCLFHVCSLSPILILIGSLGKLGSSSDKQCVP